MEDLKEKIERVIVVGFGPGYVNDLDSLVANPLDEIKLLAKTAGAEVVGSLVQNRSSIDPAYYLGKGKAEELHELVKSLEATTVVFDNDFSPAQGSNLEKLLEVKVIDRSGLILDIFALRAKTREAKIQVELAQLKYYLPRLTRQWTHLSRQQGGIGTRGPGETQLEVDRRSVRTRISHLTEILDKVEQRRSISNKKRTESFKASLVGYTNAGKSSLLNALCGTDAPVENKLFKTLDAVTRRVRLETAKEVLLSDTVGFIRNLPHDLVASFKSTLNEVRDADALLHVVDIANPDWEDQMEVVMKVLGDLDVYDTDTLIVFNKIDLIEDENITKALQTRFPDAVFVSTVSMAGIEALLERLTTLSLKGHVMLTLDFGPDNSHLLKDIYRYGTVIDTSENGEFVKLTFSMPTHVAQKIGLCDKN